MSKTIQILESDVQDLVRGVEDLNSKIAAIKSINESGIETTISGNASASQVCEDMKTLQNNFNEFHAELQAEFHKLGNKESYVSDLIAAKSQILDIFDAFKESLAKNEELDEAIQKEEDEVDEIEGEIAEFEAQIAEEITEMDAQRLEYEEKEKELDAEKNAIKEEIENKKKLLEAEIADTKPNVHYDGGDQSRSSSFVA